MRLTALISLTFVACSHESLAPREGFVQVPGGRVWYRIVGSGARTPLLLLHGGPGVPSYYLKPLAALADERPVVFYEQLGSGRSDHPADTTLWRVERFMEELATLRRALGLRQVHLYGHSWGSMLAVEYLLTRPEGVKSVILAGAPMSMARYQHDDDSLRATLPDSIRAVLVRHERAQTCDAPEYQAALGEYYRHFFARRLPWSPNLDSSVAGYDPIPDRAMFGGCRSTSGRMGAYDRTDRLGEIKLPVLWLVGRHDPATPAATRDYQKRVPGSELEIFEESGHLPMQDEPERYVAVIRDFLRRVEQRP